eukprot:CAMPEP_0197578868 /NCGR_PEP_ID=MMETSP1326-20131121/2976_1 /TAXON_ID=1155430 /ORGANISM="Genus nov. species nov., Strain RCC2288" /LENGTH=166 /DNA_ID=CAMNT_0043142151 /DNA_START=86 /DNA_END=589 /DNA_ORIENTATION=-
MAAIAPPTTALLRAPVTSTRVTCKAPRGGGIVALRPSAARPAVLGRGRSAVVRASAADSASAVVYSGVSQAIPELAGVGGLDTSAFDEFFVNAASTILPAWLAIVGLLFIVGTVYKVAFPDKYDDAIYKDKALALVAEADIDLDNLSAADLAAVAALEEERRQQGK